MCNECDSLTSRHKINPKQVDMLPKSIKDTCHPPILTNKIHHLLQKIKNNFITNNIFLKQIA